MYRQIRLSVKPIPVQTGGIASLYHTATELPRNGNNDDETQSPGVYQWLATHPEGPSPSWTTVMDRPSVEQHLFNYNRESFRAAAASPCEDTGESSAKFLTYSALSPAGTELLNGRVPPEWCDNQELLHELLPSFSDPTVSEREPSYLDYGCGGGCETGFWQVARGDFHVTIIRLASWPPPCNNSR
jgi:hypothetical protein